MKLPEAQAKIANMSIDFAHWFDKNPRNKTANAKGDLLIWVKSLLEAQQVLDTEIVRGIGENLRCVNCGKPLQLEVIEQRILNQNKWIVTSHYYGCTPGVFQLKMGHNVIS